MFRGPAPLSQLLQNGGDVLLFCNKCGQNGELATSVFLEVGATPETPIIDLARVCRCTRCGAKVAQSQVAVPSKRESLQHLLLFQKHLGCGSQ